MRVYRNAWLCLLTRGYLTMQIPDIIVNTDNVVGPMHPDADVVEVPDEFIWFNTSKIPFMSPKGYKHWRADIARAIQTATYDNGQPLTCFYLSDGSYNRGHNNDPNAKEVPLTIEVVDWVARNFYKTELDYAINNVSKAYKRVKNARARRAVLQNLYNQFGESDGPDR